MHTQQIHQAWVELQRYRDNNVMLFWPTSVSARVGGLGHVVLLEDVGQGHKKKEN